MKVYVKKSNTPEERDANFDFALKTFKRRVTKDGTLLEVKKREYYVKPGVKKRLKREAAAKARRTKKY